MSENFFYFSFLCFFLRFTEFRPLEFVGQRMKVYLRDEGYTWVPKTWDFTENSGKTSENPNFWFFLDLRRSNGQNFSGQELKLLYATRATRGYRNHGISPIFKYIRIIL